jgi:hypothetical protein
VFTAVVVGVLAPVSIPSGMRLCEVIRRGNG